ncbi:MAG TPA: amino acid ABC transporter substrate-binding protein, partial [Clostridiales bacterium]|nr:amino acid ABC transporter substrate-binding protein [Clostridiales bacterium]
MDFSVSYATNMQVAVIKKSNSESINSVNTVKSAKIAVEEGSAGDTVATGTLQASKINRVTSQVQSILEVKAGTSEVAIIDYTMAYSIIGKGSYEDLMIVNTNAVSFNQELFGVGARKKSNLVSKLNEFFKEKYQDGTLARLAEQYVSVALNDQALGNL